MAATSSNPTGHGFLLGGGEMARLIAEFDWSRTPLGPIADWPEPIKTTVGLILRSPVPIVTLWGEAGIMIYNDSYSRFAARRHPKFWALRSGTAGPRSPTSMTT